MPGDPCSRRCGYDLRRLKRQRTHRTAAPLEPLRAHPARPTSGGPVHQDPRASPRTGLAWLDPDLPHPTSRRAAHLRKPGDASTMPSTTSSKSNTSRLKLELTVNFVTSKSEELVLPVYELRLQVRGLAATAMDPLVPSKEPEE